MRARVEELIDLLGLGAFRDKYVRELSTGSRRVVDLACVLAHGPTGALARRAVVRHRPARGRSARAAAAAHPRDDRREPAHHRARRPAAHVDLRPDDRARPRRGRRDRHTATRSSGIPASSRRIWESPKQSSLGAVPASSKCPRNTFLGGSNGNSRFRQRGRGRQRWRRRGRRRSGGSRLLKRYGPIALVVVIIVGVIAVVSIVNGGDDDDSGVSAARHHRRGHERQPAAHLPGGEGPGEGRRHQVG